MHDDTLEDRLRQALHDEAEAVPLEVDVERLEARLRVRRATRRSNRTGLLAAGIGIVALGVAAVGLNGGLGPVGRVGEPPATGPAPDCRPLDLAGPGAASELPTWTGLIAIDEDGTRHSGSLRAYRDANGDEIRVSAYSPPKPSELPFGSGVVSIEPAFGRCVSDIRVEALDYPTADPDPGAATVDPIVLVARQLTEPERSITFEHPANGDWLLVARATLPTTDGRIVWTETVFAFRAHAAVASPGVLAGTLPRIAAPEGTLAFDESSPNRAPTGTAGSVVTRTLGSLPEAASYELSVVCLGPGELTYAVVESDTSDPIMSSSVACDAIPDGSSMSVDAPGDKQVLITVDEAAAWRVIGATRGEVSGVVLPTRLLVSASVPPDVGVEALVGCGANVEPTIMLSGPFNRCRVAPWPLMDRQPVVSIERGGELSVWLDNGWRLDQIEVSAAPFAGIDGVARPPDITDVYESDATTDVALIPIDLQPGASVLEIQVAGHHGDEAFHAAMYVRIEVGG
jgi:hypothetical protein